jgi:hypothetical protein
MAYVQIMKAVEATWEDYERVAAAVGDATPAGLVFHAAGEVDGRWQSVSVWESKEAYEAFREGRLMPAVTAALGEQFAAAGPPPEEWFEIKRVMGGERLLETAD